MNFYVVLQIVFVSIAATSAMTLFSYVMSKSFRELYKEPVLLTFALTKTKAALSMQSKTTLGWLFTTSLVYCSL